MIGLNKIQSVHIYYFFLICFLSFFVFAFPPLQKPDEPLHFERAFALAMGQAVCKHDAKHERGYFTFPRTVSTFPDAMRTSAIVMKLEGKFPLALLRQPYPIRADDTVDLQYHCALPFTGYIPLSLGILVTMPLNNLLVSFYAARVFAALFFAVALYISLRLDPYRYRLLIMFSSILPMVLQQVTAVSYDSVSIATGFILFSLFARYLEKRTVSLRELFIYYGVLMVFLFTKPGYYLFAILLFIPLRLVRIPMAKKIALSFILSAGMLASIWYSLMLPI